MQNHNLENKKIVNKAIKPLTDVRNFPATKAFLFPLRRPIFSFISAAI